MMADSPARQGFYEGVFESFENGYSPLAISQATGLSLSRVHEIIQKERSRRREVCCLCHHPATSYLCGMDGLGVVEAVGLFTCDDHEMFVASGIVNGNGYAGIWINKLKADEPKELGIPGVAIDEAKSA